MAILEPVSLEQQAIISRTFRVISQRADETAALFYGRLFELDPTLKPLFKGDMKAQGQKLIQVISVAVASLNVPMSFVPAIRALGQRHIHYGAQPHHYDTVGEALLWALAEVLGDDFTPEARDAWATIYTMLAEVAKESAY